MLEQNCLKCFILCLFLLILSLSSTEKSVFMSLSELDEYWLKSSNWLLQLSQIHHAYNTLALVQFSRVMGEWANHLGLVFFKKVTCKKIIIIINSAKVILVLRLTKMIITLAHSQLCLISGSSCLFLFCFKLLPAFFPTFPFRWVHFQFWKYKSHFQVQKYNSHHIQILKKKIQKGIALLLVGDAHYCVYRALIIYFLLVGTAAKHTSKLHLQNSCSMTLCEPETKIQCQWHKVARQFACWHHLRCILLLRARSVHLAWYIKDVGQGLPSFHII